MEFTQELVKELFDYHSDGYLIWKKVNPQARSIKIGDVAGHKNSHGYIKITYFGKKYAAHKLVFLFHKGFMPIALDHIDGNRINNKIDNLRLCTSSQNSCNRKTRSDSLTGIKGIRKNGNRFKADICVNQKYFYLGSFKTAEEAHEAYKKAALELHGEFARF